MSEPAGSDEVIRTAVLSRFEEEVDFLAALVRRPSDNPPDDCAPHAEYAAGLLEELGSRLSGTCSRSRGTGRGYD